MQWLKGGALVAAIAVTAACGASGAAPGAGGGPTKARPSTGPVVEGCADALTDLDVHDGSVGPARCKPGAPAPVPLKESRKVVIGLPGAQTETFNPVLVGKAKGEFKKENLEVEFHTVNPSDFYTLLANKTIDVSFASNAAMYNSISSGFNIRWVLGIDRNQTKPQSGFWGRSDVSLQNLEGKTIGTATGTGSATILPLYDAMQSAGKDLGKVKFTQIPSSDAVVALRNSAVDAAIVTDPYWKELDGDPKFKFLAPSGAVGESSNGLAFGPRLLAEEPEVGVAFARAYIRTLSTYFTGDYKKNDDVVGTIAKEMRVPVEKVKESPPKLFDYEVRNGVSDRLQAAFRATDVLTGDDIPENEVVDRYFILAAIGGRYE